LGFTLTPLRIWLIFGKFLGVKWVSELKSRIVGLPMAQVPPMVQAITQILLMRSVAEGIICSTA
jgi:hypothetical protein